MLRFIFSILMLNTISCYAQKQDKKDDSRIVKDAPGLKKGEFYHIRGNDTTLIENPVASNPNAVEKGRDTFEVKNPNTGETETFVLVDRMPDAPYDIPAYLAKNINYPNEVAREHIEGKIKVQFMVQADGSITDVKVIKGLHPLMDAEVIRVVKSMPEWRPARKDGKAVPCNYTLPVLVH